MIGEIVEKGADQQHFLYSIVFCSLFLIACKLVSSYIQYRLASNSVSCKKFEKENSQAPNGKPPTLNLDLKED